MEKYKCKEDWDEVLGLLKDSEVEAEIRDENLMEDKDTWYNVYAKGNRWIMHEAEFKNTFIKI